MVVFCSLNMALAEFKELKFLQLTLQSNQSDQKQSSEGGTMGKGKNEGE